MSVTPGPAMVSVMFLITTDMDIIIPMLTLSTAPAFITLAPITTRVFTPGPSGRRTMVRPGCS